MRSGRSERPRHTVRKGRTQVVGGAAGSDDLLPYLRRVQEQYPGFSATSGRTVEAGQNNRVVLFDNAWIFRFPRHGKGGETLRHEVDVLRQLQGRVPVPIPNPAYVHFADDDPGKSYVGYRFLEGVPLTRQLAAGLTEERLRSIAASMVAFLDGMHRAPIDYTTMRVQSLDHWRNMFSRIGRLLFPHMRLDARRQTGERFEGFLSHPESRTIPAVLIHGDFGGANLLLTDPLDALSAVLDFGSACLGDPAIDYAAASTIHPRMFEFMVAANPGADTYARRVDFYRGTFALQDALHGAECGDANALRDGLRAFT